MRVIVDLTPPQQPPAFDTIRPEPPKPEEPKPARPIQPVTEPTTPISPSLPYQIDIEAAPTPTPIPVASQAEPEVIVITRPDWLRRPTNLQIYYPNRARDRGVEGIVQLDCLVQVDGRLNCNLVSETPGGWQFGNAALRIARDHRMVPATRDGVPVEARYRMRVPFNLDER
jgi:protein TonB